MATASGKDIKFDIPLSNFAVAAFAEGADQFVGSQLFPSVSVSRQSDKYYTFTKGSFLRVPGNTALRAPGDSAKNIEWEISSDSYFARNWALTNKIPLEDLANQDIAVGMRENSTRVVVNQLMRDQEQRIANLVTSISNVGSGVVLSGTAKWSDYTNSDPIATVNTAHAFIRNKTGLVANTMLMDWDTFQIVRRNPSLLDLYKYTSGGQLSDEVIASCFKVDRLLIGKAVKENQVEGANASSITNIWGNNAILAYVAPPAEMGLQAKTLGARFAWRDPIYPADFGVLRTVQNEAGSRHVEILEAGHFQDEKIIATDLGYAITSTI